MPNVYLTAALSGDPKVGVWNSAHFKNDQYDELVRAVRGGARRRLAAGVAKQIQELLLDETPIIFPYFYNFLSAAKPNLHGRGLRGDWPVRSHQGRVHLLSRRLNVTAAGASGSGRLSVCRAAWDDFSSSGSGSRSSRSSS